MKLYNVYSFFNQDTSRNFINLDNAKQYASSVNGSIDEYNTTMYEIVKDGLQIWDLPNDKNYMIERINIAFNVI